MLSCKERTRITCLLVFVWMMTFVMAGCSETTSDESTVQTEKIQSEDNSVIEENSVTDEIVLTMAISGNPEIEDVVEEFNASNNGYQIELKRYGASSADDPESLRYADFDLLQDIVKGKVDVVCSLSFSDSAYYEILKNKEVLVDLYTFMENDEEVNCSTLNQHVLKTNERNGKLYSLPTFYGVTTLIGKSEYVGTKENWTTEEFVAHWKQMPEGATICGYTQSENIYYFLLRNNLDAFIDYNNQEVHFDSSDFVEIMEFCSEFDSNHGMKGVHDADAPEFVSPCYIDGFSSTAGMFQEDSPYTLVGYPSSDGTGAFLRNVYESYSICANISTEKQQGAWEFIRTFATYQYQKSHMISSNGQGGIPINNKVLDETAKEIIDGKYSDGTYTVEGIPYKASLPTQEDYEGFLEYVNHIERWEPGNHGAIWTIVAEETAAFFSGEKSLDDTIKMIQSRATIWISEQG